MIVLLEAHPYRKADLEGLIDPSLYRELTGGRAAITHVGYLGTWGTTPGVLILPKVFRDRSGKVLGQYTPEQLLNIGQADSPIRQQLRHDKLPTGGSKLDFLFQFSVWLYRAIRQFGQRHPASELTDPAGLLNVSGAGRTGLSELEVILALVRFHRDNNALLTHIKRTNTAQRHTVSWSRTVTRQQPVLQNGRPVYVQPVVKQKQVNYDEELIVLYLSTLADLREQYGFRLELNPLYARLSKPDMARFRARAVRRLKEIRNQYFSDNLLRVWQLLMLYYERQEQMRTQRTHRERLLVRDFNIVFEDMIDYLLSDPDNQLPPGLKDQPDGKRVDHIYAYRDLIRPDHDQLYHIGDSKYYRPENEVGNESVFKQFTYARNVIQQNIDLLNANELERPFRYRDDLTEGYNPTPNFFISALVGNTLDFTRDDLKFRQDYDQNYHFVGRLFDRDTLLLQAYDINFLFVLHAYVTPRPGERERFRDQTRQEFRQRLVDYLNRHYTFWRVTPQQESLDDFVTRHFRKLAGRMYRPSDFANAILLALPQPDPTHLLPQLGTEATVEPYNLTPVL
ncbi:MAG: LlaJI family restriction endonuclease [Cytophagales bacterium]|nr:MAG: LlaJI family restriction endonuclease [Cytophagales bacterium]